MDNKLGLNRREYRFFTAQIIACGDLHLLEIDQEKALKLLRDFFEEVATNNFEADDYVNFIYRRVQNSMLANRSYSFEMLQEFPPFNEFGKKNLIQLLKFRKEKGVEAFENGFKRIFRDGWEDRKPEQEIIRILSGNGQTIETPVKFSTDDVAKRIRAEYWFITYNFGKENEDWERGVHYSVMQPKTHKMVSNWNITLNDGKRQNIYFDTNRE